MELHECILTRNDCCRRGTPLVPRGVMVHSTGANNPYLRRYVQPDDGELGKNRYDNDWNRPGLPVCVHAFLGKKADGGMICTVSLSFLTVVFGFLLALVLALMRMSRVKPLSIFASIYVEVFRATPMLVQLFIIYYIVFGGVSLPSFKLFGFIRFERFLPGVISLALNSAAYLSEIIRAGIQSIDPGQSEAARSLGLTRRQTLQSIVLPQAIKNILPAIANEFVTIIKESSICYTIGVQEIMSAVNSVKSATFSIGEPLIIAACVYFCLTFPTSKIIQYFERRMSRGDRR